MSALEVISYITAFQLFQLGIVLLFSKRGHRKSNWILATYMFLNTLLIVWYSIGPKFLQSAQLGTAFYFLIAPYLYLYVSSLCKQNVKRNAGELLHWIPAILTISAGLLNLWYETLIQVLLHIQIIVYLILSFNVLMNYRKKIREHFSSLAEINLNWLLLLLFTFFIMWSVDLLGFVLNEFNLLQPKSANILALISISINLIFATSIVINGMRQEKVFVAMKEAKYSKSGLSKTEQNELGIRIRQSMEREKFYLKPELSLKDLADELEISSKYLSQVINGEFKKTFYDFINSYRIQEAKRIMLESPQKTILEILYEVGYNSKSAFNKAFKNITEETPTEFRKNYKMRPLS